MSLQAVVSLALGAILVENFVLVKFLGICPFLGVSKKMDTAVGMGFSVIFVMGAAAAATWLVRQFILVPLNIEYLQTMAFVVVIATLVQIVEIFLQKSIPSLYQSLGIYLPLIATNCAVLGVALMNAQNPDAGLLYSVLHAVFAGCGFLIALLLFASIRERLQFADYPETFEGVPISLVTAGLLAMVFMGFAGLKVF